MGVLVVVIAVALFVFSLWYKSPLQKGKRGEKKIADILVQLPEEYLILNDVVLSKGSGTTQIDHIVVSKYGVFAIETKNYRGDIYGDDNRKEWTQVIATNVTYLKKWYKTYTYITKNKFYNPIKQAFGHVCQIGKVLTQWPNLKIIPIVVFTGKADLRNVVSKNHVVYDDMLLSTILGYKTIYLTDADVLNVVQCLTQNDVRGLVSNQAHVQNIRNAQKARVNKIATGICPVCGGQLVPRKGKFGLFYGCSNYPKCKFTT